jgi:hypothetical protein
MSADPTAATGTMAKTFYVSFHKVGTTSIRKFFLAAGFTTCQGPHHVDGVDYMEKVGAVDHDPVRVVDALAPVIERFEAHCGVPYPGLFPVLAERYPEARFILMTRNLDNWWNSIRIHWSLWLLDHALTPFEYVQYRPYLGNAKRVVSLKDKDLLIDAHRRHNEEVQRRLEPHRLLVCRLDDPHKAEKLADFLGLPQVVPYPHAKKTGFARHRHRLLKNVKTRLAARLR